MAGDIEYSDVMKIAKTVADSVCVVPLVSYRTDPREKVGYHHEVDFQYDGTKQATSLTARFDEGYFGYDYLALVGDPHPSPGYDRDKSRYILGVAPMSENLFDLARKLLFAQFNTGKRFNAYAPTNMDAYFASRSDFPDMVCADDVVDGVDLLKMPDVLRKTLDSAIFMGFSQRGIWPIYNGRVQNSRTEELKVKFSEVQKKYGVQRQPDAPHFGTDDYSGLPYSAIKPNSLKNETWHDLFAQDLLGLLSGNISSSSTSPK